MSEDTELRTSAERRTYRREIIRQFVENPARVGREFPTVRELQAVIEREMGQGASTATVKGDLVAMDIKNPRAKKRPAGPAGLFVATSSEDQHGDNTRAGVMEQTARAV